MHTWIVTHRYSLSAGRSNTLFVPTAATVAVPNGRDRCGEHVTGCDGMEWTKGCKKGWEKRWEKANGGVTKHEITKNIKQKFMGNTFVIMISDGMLARSAIRTNTHVIIFKEILLKRSTNSPLLLHAYQLPQIIFLIAAACQWKKTKERQLSAT